MTNGEITPNTLWPNAVTGKVVVEGKTYHNVPILRVLWTPATITIRKDQYPDGLIILNENPVPNYVSPITLPTQSVKKSTINIDVTENVGWPNGSVVLFE